MQCESIAEPKWLNSSSGGIIIQDNFPDPQNGILHRWANRKSRITVGPSIPEQCTWVRRHIRRERVLQNAVSVKVDPTRHPVVAILVLCGLSICRRCSSGVCSFANHAAECLICVLQGNRFTLRVRKRGWIREILYVYLLTVIMIEEEA